jgi:tetratricopeptide (TPR) repeat protein
MWVSIGLYNIIDLFKKKYNAKSFSKFIPVIILPIAFVLIPARLWVSNYHEQDRSKDWLPWDVAYNLLQSCANDAVLFTNGDNDTFPLWYLQEVEGVRQDVRVACLSLVNTNWYTYQLKHDEPHGAKKIDMSLTDEEIDKIGTVRWETQNFTISVPKNVYAQFGITDTAITNSGKVKFEMIPTLNYGDAHAVRPQDQFVLSIIMSNNWKRPIYFASTCSEDCKIGLGQNLRLEGMAYRLVPSKNKNKTEYLDEALLSKNLLMENPSISKTYQQGFLFRGLNDKNIYFDDNHRGMIQNYRMTFLRLAIYYAYNDQKEKASAVIDILKKKIPFDGDNTDYRILFDITNLYSLIGNMDEYKKLALQIEPKAIAEMSSNANNVNSYYSPYNILLQLYENLHEYDKAISILKKLESFYPNDPTIRQMESKYDSLKTAK